MGVVLGLFFFESNYNHLPCKIYCVITPIRDPSTCSRARALAKSGLLQSENRHPVAGGHPRALAPLSAGVTSVMLDVESGPFADLKRN